MASNNSTVFASDLADLFDFLIVVLIVEFGSLPAVLSSPFNTGLTNDSVNAIERRRDSFRFMLKTLIANKL